MVLQNSTISLIGKFITWRTLQGNRSGKVYSIARNPDLVVAHCGGRCEVHVSDIISVRNAY